MYEERKNQTQVNTYADANATDEKPLEPTTINFRHFLKNWQKILIILGLSVSLTVIASVAAFVIFSSIPVAVTTAVAMALTTATAIWIGNQLFLRRQHKDTHMEIKTHYAYKDVDRKEVLQNQFNKSWQVFPLQEY